MVNLDDYIHGDKFVGLCEYKIDTNDFQIDPSKLMKNQLVYVKTDKIQDFFNVVRDLPYKYVIITHNSDHNITEEVYKEKPVNVLHWFAQNCLVEKSDVTPIPIGMERPGIAGSGDIEVLKRNQGLSKDILAYCNISVGTNPRERTFEREQPFIVNDYDRITFESFIQRLSHSYYTISPPGNGHDCHRTWEALYMGSIPILLASPMSMSFSKIIPMIVVQSYGELNERYLKSMLEKNLFIIRGASAITFSYWRDLILRKANDILQ